MLTALKTLDNDPVGILTRQSITTVVASKIFTTSLVILYPVKFTVGLWIENKNMAGIFNDFLHVGASALEVLCRQK